jgi:hypothetical protein
MPVKEKSRQKGGGELLQVFHPLEPEAGTGAETLHQAMRKGRLVGAAFPMPNYSKISFFLSIFRIPNQEAQRDKAGELFWLVSPSKSAVITLVLGLPS